MKPLEESYRNEAGKATHRILYSLGKVEDYGGEVKALLQGELEELGTYN